MSMFCYQCQEALNNTGCTKKGVCGKSESAANLQDLLVFAVRGLAVVARQAKSAGVADDEAGKLIMEALFVTITNVNFDDDAIAAFVTRVLDARDTLAAKVIAAGGTVPDLDVVSWRGDVSSYGEKSATVGVLAQENEDVRSLRELLIYGVKGVAAYAHHALMLGKADESIEAFLVESMASTVDDLSMDEMVGLVLKAGEIAVTTMALLDGANTGAYGNPELTEVNLGVRNNPGILISGHDLKDLEELLAQTDGSGVDVYTHGEMLPAHYYPAFKKYEHFVGNYGGAWYDQKKDFEAFGGPILMTTNCLVPPSSSYADRVFTTGVVGFQGLKHIADRPAGGAKDFSAVIELAKKSPAPKELETGTLVGGFAHAQVLALADKVVDAVKSGAVKKFVVMAGCDGRQSSRQYFTDVARELPDNTIILTAGCAKFRYNKLDIGDIGGIPRVLDAGQCNDSYSLAVVALKLKEVFGLDDINDLPIEYDIAWYEQKAVAVLLALLHLGVKGIRLGPTLPAFLSPNVAKVLVDNFGIQPTGDVAADVAAMTA